MNKRFLSILIVAAALATPLAAETRSSLPEVDVAGMDKSVKPGDDFYKYANGKWLASFKIPSDKSSYYTFDALRDKAESDIRAVLDEVAKTSPAAGSTAKKVLELYDSWMDEKSADARGAEPLKADFEAIAAARNKAAILRLMGRFDYSGPVGIYIQPDPDDPTRYAVAITQSGLGMPSREYYLNKGGKFDAYRTAYKTYVTKIFELAGDMTPSASAASVIALENQLAAVHWPPERQRDVKATNNPMDRAGLKRTIPAIDWDSMLEVAGLADVQHFVVNETSALRDGAKLLDTQPIEAWQKYLTFHLASDYASYLSKAFDDASFDFHEKSLLGVESQRDRWKRGVGLLNAQIGEGIGQLYVAKYFPPHSKALMDQLVDNLRTAMGERLKTLAWMDDATRAEAQKKLTTFEPRIGYPSQWRDYSRLTIEPGRLFENVRNAKKFEWERQVVRLDKPVERFEWWMNAQTVDAYYNPLTNQITFPAGILQPPFFDPNADAAVNYGAIGAVIGHEMGHGFDDQGREYDEAGKIRNWWTPETNKKFVMQTDKLSRQYNAFCPLEGVCVNGKPTMGENIGDLGGLEMAYTAYKLSLSGKDAPVLGGLTGDQRFFLAHAQIWRGLVRDDQLRNSILTNPHAPVAARGSMPERNMDAWYAAFDVKKGDRLYRRPEDRVKIW